MALCYCTTYGVFILLIFWTIWKKATNFQYCFHILSENVIELMFLTRFQYLDPAVDSLLTSFVDEVKLGSRAGLWKRVRLLWLKFCCLILSELLIKMKPNTMRSISHSRPFRGFPLKWNMCSFILKPLFRFKLAISCELYIKLGG